ncbi:MAG: signal peptidase II [Puia sp.]
MKGRKIIFIVLLIIVADQVLKIWIKTHMPLSHTWDAFYRSPVSPYDNGIHLLGKKFQLFFVENEGMALGMEIWRQFWKDVPHLIPPGCGDFWCLLYTHPDKEKLS